MIKQAMCDPAPHVTQANESQLCLIRSKTFHGVVSPFFSKWWKLAPIDTDGGIRPHAARNSLIVKALSLVAFADWRCVLRGPASSILRGLLLQSRAGRGRWCSPA